MPTTTNNRRAYIRRSLIIPWSSQRRSYEASTSPLKERWGGLGRIARGIKAAGSLTTAQVAWERAFIAATMQAFPALITSGFGLSCPAIQRAVISIAQSRCPAKNISRSLPVRPARRLASSSPTFLIIAPSSGSTHSIGRGRPSVFGLHLSSGLCACAKFIAPKQMKMG
jgi:hypothetical protein